MMEFAVIAAFAAVQVRAFQIFFTSGKWSSALMMMACRRVKWPSEGAVSVAYVLVAAAVFPDT